MSIIRPGTVDDARGIAVVEVEAWRAAYAGIVPVRLLAGLSVEKAAAAWRGSLLGGGGPGGTHVAVSAGEVVGFVRTGAAADPDLDPTSVGEVMAIYVHPAEWRQGHGRHLMAAGLSQLSGSGFEESVLWVLEANRPGRAFYETEGWVVDRSAGTRRCRRSERPEIRYRIPVGWDR